MRTTRSLLSWPVWLCVSLCVSLPALAAKKQPAARAAAAVKAAAPVGHNAIALDKPGAAPKAVLRYKFSAFKGVKMYVTTKMLMRLKMQMGNRVRQSPAIPTPGLQVETTLHSKGTQANGQTLISGVITGIKVLPSVKASPMVIIQLRRALGKLKGMKMLYVFDAQGRLLRGGFKAPKGSSQQMRQILNNLKQNMQQIVIPLPAEPVGIGATWTATTLVSKPVKLKQATTYSLKKTSGGRISVSANLKQTASPQVINSRSPYGPVQNRIHYLRTSGTGATQVGLNKLFIRTNTRGVSDMKITVTVRKTNRTINFNMNMTNEIKAGK